MTRADWPRSWDWHEPSEPAASALSIRFGLWLPSAKKARETCAGFGTFFLLKVALARAAGIGRDHLFDGLLDGAGVGGVVTRGVGSLRYRITLQGPGGHPWADAATPSPIHALGHTVARLSQLSLPAECTVNVGRWGGGTSVNSIATDAWVEVELRAAEPTHLDSLDKQLHEIVRAECAGLSGQGRGPKLVSSLALLGSRPAGMTPDDSPLVQAALDATLALGGRVDTGASSTDANGPMARGIAAITMGAGGQAGLAHTPSEWYHNADGPTGIARALLTLLLFDRS